MTTAAATNPTRQLAIGLLKWLLAIGILAFLYWMSHKSLADLRNREILWWGFGLALCMRFLSLLATFTRWRLLVLGNGLPFSFRESFRLGMLGEGCNLMGPGAVGGDLVKAAILAVNYPSRIASAFSTVFLDRILGLWALFVLGAIASLIPTTHALAPELRWTIWALWGGALGGLIGLGLMFVPAFTHSRLMHWLTTWKFVGRIVRELMDSIQLYQGRPTSIILAAGLGMLGHLGFLSVFYFCAVSLHGGQTVPNYVEHLVGLPLPEALSAAVPTPAGVGALEWGVGWFYQQHQAGLNPNSTSDELRSALSNGILTALGYRLTTVVWGAVGLIYYLISRREIQRAVHGMEAETYAETPHGLN